MAGRILVIALLTLTCSLAGAADPSPLQDFCVADLTSTVFVNGYPCKPPNTVTSDDFFYSGLNIRTDTNNLFGFNVTGVVVQTLPGLNTLGVSLGRIDYAYRGLNPPHTHPRATEIFTCLEGTLLVGFVSSSPDNKFYSKVLHAGDVFIFPQAMIHFQFNVGKNKAVALVAFGSQNPGLIPVANAMFGSHPPIDPVVLAKTFQLDKKIVLELQAIFGAM